jgi:hypothetical protein
MRVVLQMALVLGLLTGVVGCKSQYSVQRPVATTEPPLIVSGSDEPSVAASSPSVSVSPPVTVVKRRPIVEQPQYYYESTNGNKLAKTAAATFIGVPAGVVGEVRQLFMGPPPPPTIITPTP